VGDATAALTEIRQAQQEITQAQLDAPEALAADLAEEAAEHLRRRSPQQVTEDEALIEASNDVALSGSQW